MRLKWHPSDDLLADYGAGALAEGWSLAVAAHLAMCPDCRAEAIALDAIGGAVLDGLPEVPMSDSALDHALAAIQDARQQQPEPPKPANPAPVLPAPLAEYVGGDVDAIRWRSIGGKVRQCILDTGGEASARLLTIPPGAAVPEHSHSGREIILVLQGSVFDGDAVYGPGDVQQADTDVTHMPAAGPGEECICLLVTDGPLKFTGLLPKLAGMFAKL
jgi:putative transcriptional regulator